MSGGLRIVFVGTAEFAVPSLRALVSSPHEVVGVITRPDRPAGRGRRLRPCPVKVAAEEMGLPLHQPELVSSEEGLELLRGLAPEVLLLIAFGELLSEEVLATPSVAALNLHPSLVPKYRGASPIQRAILAGETETGVTMQWMAPEMDAGDVLLQWPVAIGPEEDCGSLYDRLAELGARMTLEALKMVASGCAPRTPQPEEGVTYAPPIRREELVIDWGKEAEHILRMIRAFSPRPGARTRRAGKWLKILKARGEEPSPRPDRHTKAGTPGRIVEVSKEGFWVETGKERVLALKVQPEARPAMSAADYVRGYRLSVGEQLG